MLLSEHVYCVAVAYKVTEQVEEQICIKFCVRLEHSSMETLQMIQRLQLWATGSFITATRLLMHLVQRFFVKHQITQVTQPPYSPDLAPSDFWLFPKLKSPLKGKSFQTIDEIQENTTGQLMAIGRTM